MNSSTHSTTKNHKKDLSIRLSESAVYLRTEGHGRRSTDPRSSLLRGLLVLELLKPTKITSIELELTATSCNLWPEGSGARRVDLNEEHTAFHASTVYFQANKLAPSTRRAVSLGPGVTTTHDQDQGWEEGQRRVLASANGQSASAEASDVATRPPLLSESHSSPAAPSRPNLSLRDRRASADSHFFLSNLSPYQETRDEVPIPPYSPTDPNGPTLVASPLSATFHDRPWVNLTPSPEEGSASRTQRPSQDLEGFRASLNINLRTFQHNHDPSTSTRSAVDRSALSRVPTIMDDVPEDDTVESPRQLPSPQGPSHLRPDASPSPDPPAHSPTSSLSGSGESSTQPSDSHSRPGLLRRFSGDARSPSTSKAVTSRGREGGRSRSRFSLSTLSDALMDAVRSTSTSRAARLILPSSERASRRKSLDTRDPPPLASASATPRTSHETARDRERSSSRVRRGRTMDRRAVIFGGMDGSNTALLANDDNNQASNASPNPNDSPSTTRSTSTINPSKPRPREGVRIWGAAFDSDLGNKEKQDNHGWKEFKKGTYSYPISFTIPNTAPPSMQTPYGSVVWRLNATVHRPGTFKQKMAVSREVLVVSCPSEEDTEDTENVIVERLWEDQLHYLISISGRSFYIGGTVPVMFALVPLGKVKIYRLLVYIEERVDYYTHMHRVARTDPVTRFDLLSLKHEGGKNAPHILPLETDDGDVLKNSALAPLLDADEDVSELASALMGPGPWTFHQNLKLPSSCDMMHFTNKNRRANIAVNHVLKVVLRVERGDDLHVDKAGKRKLFDIVVQTPIQILSCRCNPEWVSLPRYSETFNDAAPLVPSCPCQIKRMQERHVYSGIDHLMGRIHVPHSPTHAGPSNIHDRPNDIVPEASNISSAIDPDVRLVAGQESEFGEPPPAYSPASPRT
ncbi:cyclin binding protein [Coprinopsis sp. MPI-PUGE-AT-0042]|nr:cyclin binding protein [Coprinopsis sp. MPI-PUGE-AT-0042]